jgi:AbiV family abortive infection protein
VKLTDHDTGEDLTEYRGPVDAVAAATGMQAARLNAGELYETAKALFESRRFAHSVALAILAVEEMGKRALLLSIFLTGVDSDPRWPRYRRHTAKTAGVNQLLVGLALAYFPALDADTLNAVAVGPSPEELEVQKQLALYSDCLASQAGPVWHLPRNLDWEPDARARLAEAAATVLNARDQTPEELALWHKHLHGLKGSDDEAIKRAVEALDVELRDNGFHAAGRLDIIMKLS